MKSRDYAFFCSLAAGMILAAALFLYTIWGKDRWIFPACPIYRYTGLWCPGCGFTRSVNCLLAGDFRESICWNPIPLYSITLWCLFITEESRERILHSAQKVPASYWSWMVRLGFLLWIIFILWKNLATITKARVF